jgi:hypothetical protein
MSNTLAEIVNRLSQVKRAGDAIFPSLQTSVSTPLGQKTGPILEADVSSQRIRPQTRDFPDPHVSGSWSRRTLGQERGILQTPAIPPPGADLHSQMIESKITQASYEGKIAALLVFGLPAD